MKYLLLGVLIVTGCGRASGNGDSAASTDTAPLPGYAMMVQDSSGLPECNAGRTGLLAYVKDLVAFRVCSGTAWDTIDLRGAKGADGVNGKDGVALHATSEMQCLGSLTKEDAAAKGVTLTAELLFFILVTTEMSNGDIHTTGVGAVTGESNAITRYWPKGVRDDDQAYASVTVDKLSWAMWLDKASSTLTVRHAIKGVSKEDWPVFTFQSCKTKTF